MDVEITIETITPVWTGDAFQQCKSLKPQSILGSLRVWLEVLCYVAGKLDKDSRKEKLDQEEFLKELNCLLEEQKEFSIIYAKRKVLEKLGISIPSQVFGCSGWEGFMKIIKIEKFSKDRFNNPLKFPSYIYRDKNNNSSSRWKLGIPYFWGKCKISLELADKKVGEDIIYPLLNFIQKYGFIGGKNNLGYGRVKFASDSVNLSNYDELRLSDDKIIEIDNVIKPKGKLADLIQDDLINERKIGLCKLQENIEKEKILDIIEELVIKKSEWRADYEKKCNLGMEEIGYVFGHRDLKVKDKRSKYKDLQGPNATKIIPWINYIEQNKYEYGFISLVLLQDFPKR